MPKTIPTPLNRPPEKKPESDKKPKVPPFSFAKLRVLIVDDDADARGLIKSHLGSFGVFQIQEAANGYKAVEFLEHAYETIDVILCDWVMPGMDGADLLRKIRSIDPDMPFIMITGLNDEDSVIQAREAGVSAYVAKPINPAKFAAKLRLIGTKIQQQKSKRVSSA
ncbi:MAG: hypothetical protein CL570_04590 [Alphaproteobacteria bacterium]|nr:hypothetical protein [Alphaproteobacteria bacterium]|tara:strand:- start:6567 stop:7064 length:498 start_codon:yes stop_codon:yes gene_type:complete